jgi:hypothetical protein
MVMDNLTSRLSFIPYLLIGLGLFFVGLLALTHILNSFWPINVDRLDIVRAVALDQAEPSLLMRSANLEIIFSFLAAIVVSVSGLMLPVAHYLNKKLSQGENSNYLVVLRQAMWVAIWAAFCTWLQINRSFGWGVAILVAAVFFVLEIMLQVRTKAADLAS